MPEGTGTQLEQAKAMLRPIVAPLQEFSPGRLKDLLDKNRLPATRPDPSIDRRAFDKLTKAHDLAKQLGETLRDLGL